jgi:hypothetical protein
LESELKKTRAQLLAESNMFNDETKLALELEVKEFLNSGKEVGNEEDVITLQSRMSARLLEIFEKLKYSDADSSLRHVYTILNFYKGVHRELNYENKRVTDKEGKLVNMREVIEGL